MAKWTSLIFLSLSLFVGGCGPSATIEGYRGVLEHYRGSHIDNLVASWGAPKGHHVYDDGRNEYLFLKEYHQEYAASPFYPSFGAGYFYRHVGFGGSFYPRVSGRYSFCETRVITDKKGNIKEYYFRGSACRAIPDEARR